MTEWPESVLEYERLTVADRTVEWNDKAEVAIRDLKKVVERAEDEARKWKWLTHRAIESFMDEWFEQPDPESWIADQLLQYDAWRGGRDV